ncbi:Acyl-[acyl-carrier-protein]--UDP-N-acetylglucosamine O-acyltransferase, partial [termite gut metagenome]
YIIAGREPVIYCGLNIVGLRRRNFSSELIENIHEAYRTIYQSGLNITDALAKIESEMEMIPEISYIVDFIRGSERGIIK